MSRKHYKIIAEAFRTSSPMHAAYGKTDAEQTAYAIARMQWAGTVAHVARSLSADAGYDLNGNRKFKMDTFLEAAGFDAAEKATYAGF